MAQSLAAQRHAGLILLLVLPVMPAAQAGAGITPVSQAVWQQLTEEQRTRLERQHIIDPIPAQRLGVIVDVQAIDQSNPGSNAGSRLGQAVGSASYIDNAFSGGPDNWNYSARRHLGAALVGALVGSALNSPAEARYHFRYSIRTQDGRLHYEDRIGSSPFHQSMGDCVRLPEMESLPGHICSENPASLRTRLLPDETEEDVAAPREAPDQATRHAARQAGVPDGPDDHPSPLVRCKFGANAPVLVAPDLCQSANGSIMP